MGARTQAVGEYAQRAGYYADERCVVGHAGLGHSFFLRRVSFSLMKLRMSSVRSSSLSHIISDPKRSRSSQSWFAFGETILNRLKHFFATANRNEPKVVAIGTPVEGARWIRLREKASSS